MRKILSRCRFASTLSALRESPLVPANGPEIQKGDDDSEVSVASTRYQRDINAVSTRHWLHVHVYRYCKSREIGGIMGIAVGREQFRLRTTKASAFSAIDPSWDRDIKSKHNVRLMSRYDT